MHWSPVPVERGTAMGEESLSLMEGGSDLDAHRRSGSFEEEEDEKDTTMHRRRRRWSGVLGEWRAQLSRAVSSSPHDSGAPPLPYTHREWFFRRLRAYIQAVLIFLLPSFLVEALPPPPPHQQQQQQQHGGGSGGRTTKAEPQPLSPTAYFDGLRGVAALIVYLFHFGYNWYPSLRDGYGAPGSIDSFWQLPIIRVLHSGRSSVTIFFVLSGYVVTAKTVSLLHANSKHKPQQQQQVLHSLSGALFRRPFRLYLPIIASTLFILGLVRLDVFPANNSYSAPPRLGTCAEQLAHWWEHTVHIVSPFRPIDGRNGLYSPPYDGHLWTIPIEFKGSITVFALILAFARVKCWLRLLGVAGAGAWLVQRGDGDGGLFCAGLLLAEIAIVVPPWAISAAAPSNSADLLPVSSSPPSDPLHQERIGGSSSSSSSSSRTRRSSAKTVGHVWTITLFILALHLLSYPETRGFSTPGYRSFSRHVPAFYAASQERCQQFAISLGAVLFLIALMYSPPVRRVPGTSRLGVYSAAIRRSIWVAVNRLFGRDVSFSSPSPPSSSSYSSSSSQSHSRSSSSSSSSISLSTSTLRGGEDADVNIDIRPERGQQQQQQQQEREEPLLQRLFTTAFAQYLGRISYALYLAHGSVDAAIGERWLQRAFGAYAHDYRLATVILHLYAGSGKYSDSDHSVKVDDLVIDLDALHLDMSLDGEAVYEGALARAHFQYAVQFLCALVINTLVLVWVSDVFWRAVDARAVAVTRRLWGWASKGAGSASA